MFLIILFLVVKFDFFYLPNSIRQVEGGLYQKRIDFSPYYFILCLLFILVSGLSYRVGSDIGKYMYDFKHLQFQDFSLKELSLSDRQPFWILSQLICKTLCDSFVLFKLFCSIFVNVVIFIFIKNNTKYIFTSILLYYVIMSFDINFNILRQSFAISTFLIAFSFLEKKKILLSLLAIFSSIMFHNSAFVLLPVPLLLLFDVRKYFKTAIVSVWLISFIIILSPTANFLLTLFLGSSDETFVALSAEYLQGDYGSSTFSIIKITLNLLYLTFISYFFKKSGASNMQLSLFFCFIICYIASYSIPILGRIKFYFTIFYIISFTEAIYFVARTYIKHNSRKLLISIILIVTILDSSKHYFIYNERLGAYNYVQYYPYYSVINPKIDNERERLVEY